MVRTVLTTAVTHAVHTVLAATVITLTGPVPMDVNQDTTLTGVSFAIQVNIHKCLNDVYVICVTDNVVSRWSVYPTIVTVFTSTSDFNLRATNLFLKYQLLEKDLAKQSAFFF